MVSAQARRSQVEFASHRGISVRRACALIGVARSTMGYESKMPAKNGPVITVMRICRASTLGMATDASTFFGSPRPRHEPRSGISLVAARRAAGAEKAAPAPCCGLQAATGSSA